MHPFAPGFGIHIYIYVLQEFDPGLTVSRCLRLDVDIDRDWKQSHCVLKATSIIDYPLRLSLAAEHMRNGNLTS